MTKINQKVYIEGNILFHRVFRSDLYELDLDGIPPSIHGFDQGIYDKGRASVMWSSHEFRLDRIATH